MPYDNTSPAIKNNTSGTAGISHRILHSLIASLSPERSSPWKTPYSVNPIITKTDSRLSILSYTFSPFGASLAMNNFILSKIRTIRNKKLLLVCPCHECFDFIWGAHYVLRQALASVFRDQGHLQHGFRSPIHQCTDLAHPEHHESHHLHVGSGQQRRLYGDIATLGDVTPGEAIRQLWSSDVRDACDLFRPVFEGLVATTGECPSRWNRISLTTRTAPSPRPKNSMDWSTARTS